MPDIEANNVDSKQLDKLFDEEDEDFDDSKLDPFQSDGVQVRSEHDFADPNVIKAYYELLFPFRYLFQWLNHSPSPSTAFAHREFAFNLTNGAYLRYRSFKTFETLRKDVLLLNPSRFEIGAVYNADPSDAKLLRASLRPKEKELVFDIDLTDYDEIRFCCQDKSICPKCWRFVSVAISIMNDALKYDFGFKHILWVYSGRRGAHAWVCDKRARMLDDDARKVLMSYLVLNRGGSKSERKLNLRRPLHKHLSRSFDICKRSFQSDILETQDPWREEKNYTRLLQYLPDSKLNEALRKKWQTHENRASANKWADIDGVARSGISPDLNSKALLNAKQDVILDYLYPRLDAEVSKKRNHLLKSPFCVHPATGMICVPIDTNLPEEFNPLTVPTVTQVLKELDNGQTVGDGDSKPDYIRTSLRPYIEYFRKFVDNLMKDEIAIKRERESDHFDGAVKFEF